MNRNIQKIKKRKMRHKRVRAKIKGTNERPRVCVFKSNRYIFAQFIDDDAGKTLISNQIGKKNKTKGNKTTCAQAMGIELAAKAKEQGIKSVVFDNGGFKYHGRIKALADGLRTGGLKF
jgi:large subunit ribosomal protein L18